MLVKTITAYALSYASRALPFFVLCFSKKTKSCNLNVIGKWKPHFLIIFTCYIVCVLHYGYFAKKLNVDKYF